MRAKIAAVSWLMLASVIVGASLGLAARANADGVVDAAELSYIQAYGPTAICPVIDQFPSGAGVMGVMQGIADDGFSADNAVDIINASVWEYCPRHWSLLEDIGAEARGETIAARDITSGVGDGVDGRIGGRL